MSLFQVFDIAGTALAAESVRLNITASNIANADAVSSSVEQTYRARRPVFSTLIDRFTGEQGPVLGVKVEGVVESQAPLRRLYQPEHPLADEQGYIHLPNVNVIEEMADMIAASRNYQTNVEVINASKQLLQQTIALGQ